MSQITLEQTIEIVVEQQNKSLGDRAFSICKGLYSLDTRNRFKYLCEYLKSKGIQYQVHYNGTYTSRNLSVYVENYKVETRVLCAHYDVVNEYNANDNTASISLLLWLLTNDLENIEDRYNYLILFTDGEESGLTGANSFGKNYKDYVNNSRVVEVLNLELTGNGDVLLSDNKYAEEHVMFPISDCNSFRTYFNNVTCLSLAPRQLIDNRDLYSLWSKCHTNKDTLDNINIKSLETMYDKLKYILQYPVVAN